MLERTDLGILEWSEYMIKMDEERQLSRYRQINKDKANEGQSRGDSRDKTEKTAT